ncbi:hypothetical protein C8A01DRAFT_35334 [Parachaetomium inaequale]|uniref:Rhodopsin domain-containing protein n=1 Tax=Parachaetomium inaequale TaxID=2588326 RepID=A0AAN6PIM4_9PEZI|nr:hypothetical protein C8A01DRAFT_35334 [Parachaetomium inaequale]
MALLPRRPEHENVLLIPTPPLQQAALFVIFFFTALAFVTFSLRAYTRIRTRQWGLDDYLVSCAMIFSLMMIGPFYMYIKLDYFGWHSVDVPQFDPAPGMWWFYLAQLFYNPILALVKASVLCLLLRLGGQKPGVKYAIHFLNAFNGLQAIAIFLVAALQCLPIEANWDFAVKADPNTKCIDNSFHVIISCITIVTDCAVIALPFWIFLGLKMPRAAKIAVLGIFMLGLAVTVIGIVRLHGVIKLFYLQQPSKDPYYDITVTLSVVEANIAIVSASAPALRPLFRSLLPSLFGGSSARYGASGANKYNYPNSNSPYIFSGAGGSVAAAGTLNGTGSRHGGPDGGSSLARGGPGHGSIRLKNLRGANKGQHTECRSISPSGSEEEIMTYNGIMRTTDVQVHFEGDRDMDRDRGHGASGGASTLTAGETDSRASSDLKAGGRAL